MTDNVPGFTPDTGTGISSQPAPAGVPGFTPDTPDIDHPHDFVGGGEGTTHPQEPVTPGQVMTGAAKEAGKTALGLTTLGIDAISGGKPQLAPETQEFMNKARELTTTHGIGEGAGGLMEQGAEWYGGEKAVTKLAGLLKIVHSAPEVMQLLNKYPAESKIIMDMMEGTPGKMAKGAVVGGTQGGVKAAAEGKSATEGAESGAEGGAVGTLLGELGVKVLGKAGESIGIGRDSLEEATRAAKPGKWNTDWDDDWKRGLPRLAARFKEIKGKGIEGVADVALKDSNDYWNNEIKPLVKGHESDTKDVSSVATTLRDRVLTPAFLKHATKEESVAIEDLANKYAGSGGQSMMSVDEMEKDIEQLNAKATKNGWWKKNASEREAAIKAGDLDGARSVTADKLRELLYDHIESFKGPNGEPSPIRDMKKTYGALRNIEHEFRGQVNVQGRQSVVSLKKILAMTAGAGVGAAAHGPVGAAIGAAATAAPALIDSAVNNPDAMAERAVKLGIPEKPVVTAAKNVGKAAVRAGTGVAGEKAAQWVTFKDKDGNLVTAHPEDAEEAMKRNGGIEIK